VGSETIFAYIDYLAGVRAARAQSDRECGYRDAVSPEGRAMRQSYYPDERLAEFRLRATDDDPGYFQRDPSTVAGLLHKLDLSVGSMTADPTEAQQLVAESVARAMETWGPSREASRVRMGRTAIGGHPFGQDLRHYIEPSPERS
jgi:hypothetical protein